MSNDETSSEKKESLKNGVSQIISSLLQLKESNPKVFFGGIGGGVLVILILMMSGGHNPEVISGPVTKNLVVGQRYVLRTPNTYDKSAPVRLVGAPGAMEAYDDTEKEDREGCKHLPQGTPVILKQLADAFGTINSVAKVTVESGECKGMSNWTSTVNVHDK